MNQASTTPTTRTGDAKLAAAYSDIEGGICDLDRAGFAVDMLARELVLTPFNEGARRQRIEESLIFLLDNLVASISNLKSYYYRNGFGEVA